MGTRADATAALTRTGRLHGWNVTPIRLGYYSLRFSRAGHSIGVRFGHGDRITDVTVDAGLQHYQLALPARAGLEELLSAPVRSQ